ncbi:MAG: hypothetical protein WBM67_11810 [Sedimenticolaceae bacterium]
MAECLRDLAYLHPGVLEHLPRYLEAALIQAFLKARAAIIQATPQCAAMHREEFGDLVRSGVICQQRRPQHTAYLPRQVVAESEFERVDLLPQQMLQIWIGSGYTQIQPVCSKHHCVWSPR